MKKQVNKLSIKTDKVVSLTKDQTNGLMGGRPSSSPQSKAACCSDLCSFTCPSWSC